MKFEDMKDWLVRRLENADDISISAGGTSLEALQRDVEARRVTPSVLTEANSDIGKVVRYVREERGWTREKLATMVHTEVGEIISLETRSDYPVPPRLVFNLAKVCKFSVRGLQELANHVIPVANVVHDAGGLRFAAQSRNISEVESEELATVGALVAALSEKVSDD